MVSHFSVMIIFTAICVVQNPYLKISEKRYEDENADLMLFLSFLNFL